MMPSSSAALLDIFYDDDGIVDPEPYWQRYRRNEFAPNRPFFQWWYFNIKDLETNKYWAFAYYVLDCAEDETNEGAYAMFGMMDKSTGEKFHKYEKYPLDSFWVADDMDVRIDCGDQEIDYRIDVLHDDVYHVHGKMVRPENVWHSDGINPKVEIEWDFLIFRVYGWFGEHDCERDFKKFGVILWDTYAHDVCVEGTIRIGDVVYEISTDKEPQRYRGYCDENWGENFPSGEPAIEYPWGWYYIGRPGKDPFRDDLSIIAGMGRHDCGFPFYDCEGGFADIRLDSETHIGARHVRIWDDEQHEYVVMSTSNDGDTYTFEVTYLDWQLYTDNMGSALIPLTQIVYIETENYEVEMLFESDLSDYSRFLAPHENYIFSDFEALGVQARLKVWYRGNLIEYYLTDDAGLEYGYLC